MDDHRDARFVEADFTGADFRGVDFSRVTISDARLWNVEISGTVDGLVVNGVDVTGYVEEVLDRRHPERKLLVATDPDGMRTAWSSVERVAEATLDRARRMPSWQLDESVGDEWTFLQTLRHLVFATDRWITGPVFGDVDPFHPLGMPNPPLDDAPRDVFDLDASPSLDDVVAVRRDRMDRVAEFLSDIDASGLDRVVPSPNGGTASVRDCLHVLFREEWWHHQYANRDLDALAAR